MKKRISRALALVMAAVLTFSISPAVNVEAKSYDVYYLSSSTSTKSISINVPSAKKITNVSSTAPKVVKPVSYSLTTGKELVDKKKTTNSGSITVMGYKPGKATIKYKADKKSYSKNIQIKKYQNPLSKLTINGKNVTSQLNKSASGATATAAKTMKVNAEGKGDWVVENITIYYSGNSSFNYHSCSYSNRPKKASYSLPNCNSKVSNTVSVELLNKKDGGEITVYVYAVPSTKK